MPRRPLLLLHRYLGMAFGLIVAAWCVSGFVMLYVPFPTVDESARIAGLEPLRLTGCCRLDASGVGEIRSFGIEMLAGTPVLRVESSSFGRAIYDLSSGAPLTAIDQRTAEAQARAFLASSGATGELLAVDRLRYDQWTVGSAFRAHSPLFRFRFGDRDESHVYVSGSTGEVVQETRATERLWNRLGAVLHWLYAPTLRRHVDVWRQVVIWTSIGGILLVVSGMYLGLRQALGKTLARGQGILRRLHYYGGLIFGLLALLWLFSGLVSVNPWGFLAGGAAPAGQRLLQTAATDPAQLSTLLERLAREPRTSRYTRIESAPLGGEPALVAWTPAGSVLRVDAKTLSPAPLDLADLSRAVRGLSDGGYNVRSAEMLSVEDGYYYARRAAIRLPVFRIVLSGREGIRHYIDPDTGRLLKSVDADGRRYRWLFEALHRGDFAALARREPVRQALLLCLLAGVTVSSMTGAYLAARHLAQRRTRRSRDA